MIHPYSRKLNNIDLIQDFLTVVLKYENADDDTVLRKIESGQAALENYKDSSATLISTNHRNRKYLKETERWKLRKQIVKELIEQKREVEDEDLCLGRGGSLPNTDIKKDKEAFIIIGLPASGKSTIANKVADNFGALILDSDYAKRKLPEFKDNPAGASLVHEESDILIFGYEKKDKPDDFVSLIEICNSNDYNIVIPKIGHDHKSINNLAKILKTVFGYTIHLILVSLDRRKATKRAVDRFLSYGRYVPLSLIFDGYGNDPILSFYRLKDNILIDKSYIDTFGKLSTDVEKGADPLVIYAGEKSPVCIFQN
jgi:Zeta toxin